MFGKTLKIQKVAIIALFSRVRPTLTGFHAISDPSRAETTRVNRTTILYNWPNRSVGDPLPIIKPSLAIRSGLRDYDFHEVL